MSEGERRLAAIMFTDMVGYASLSERSESLAMELLEGHPKLIRCSFPKHRGREIRTIGDAFLVEFARALEAVRCAFDIQQPGGMCISQQVFDHFRNKIEFPLSSLGKKELKNV